MIFPNQLYLQKPKIINAQLGVFPGPGDQEGMDAYHVTFPTGSQFWIPKEVFEQEYLPVGCNDEIPDFQQRLFGESALLDHNITKLSEFIDSLDADKVQEQRISVLQVQYLEAQLTTMMTLRMILLARLQEMGMESNEFATHAPKAIHAPASDSIEHEIQAKGLTAPRITPDDIEANIVGEYYFSAERAASGFDKSMVDRFLAWTLPKDFSPDAGISFDPPQNPAWHPIGTNLLNADQAKEMLQHVVGCAPVLPSLKLLTFCVLVLRNGFTVTGESACASPENFDAEIGRKIARENAVQKIWPLMGYELRSKLAAK